MSRKRAASELSADSLIAKKPKQAGASSSTGSAPKKDSDGNDYWEVADKRRVTISQFKNQHLVSIREYYEQNGEMKPGKKGISLTVAQFATLVQQLPAIEEGLKARGQEIGRPKYENDDADNGVADGADEDEKAPDADEKANTKKNFEETSDEEE